MTEGLPSEETARDIVGRQLGWTDATARRFTTGVAFFVYEVASGAQQVVVRIGLPQQTEVLQQGLLLMAQLKALGVPLPEILGDGEHDGFPYVVMTRLPGTDLGHVFRTLSPEHRLQIAEAVADAQMATARLARGAGFGYAAIGASAPHPRWSDVVRAHVERSRRIVANGLFPGTIVAQADRLLSDLTPQLDLVEPVPFLHDTTTKNVIVSPAGHLSGIVDVDDLCYGDPRYPAALTAASLLNRGETTGYVSAWLARAGQAWDEPFDFYVATFLLDFMSEHGTRFNGNEAASQPQDREKLTRLYEEASRRVEAGR